jgi:CHAT domain-containing protein/tetratricopeptide (TPR) repeat protein
MRGLVLTAVLGGLAVLLPARADDPPKEKVLSPEQRKELEAKVASLKAAAGAAYQAGDMDKTEKTLASALDGCRLLYRGQDSDAVANCLRDLAHVLRVQGKLAEAEPRCREALAIRRTLFKGDHPEVAIDLGYLVIVLRGLGREQEAEPLAREALGMQRRLHGGDHPEVARALNNLAMVEWAQGKYAAAEGHFRASLEMRQRIYKGDHRDVVTGFRNLSLVLHDQGKLRSAEECLRSGVEMGRRVFKPDDPDLALTMANLGQVLRAQDKLAEAELLIRDVLAMQRRKWEADHPDVANTLQSLALVLEARGRYTDAEKLHRESLRMFRRVWQQTDHPDVARQLANLANNLRQREQAAEAEPLAREALEMQQRLCKGQDHAHVATMQNILANTLMDLGKWADAERLYQKALEMWQRVYHGQDHPQIASGLNNLAFVLSVQGRRDKAEALYRDALAMNERLYQGRNHSATADALSSLAIVLWARGKYLEAEPLFKESLEIYCELATDYASIGSEGEALTLASNQPFPRDWFLSNSRANRSDPATAYAAIWSSKAVVARVAERRALATRAATDPRAAALLAEMREVRGRRTELLLAPRPAGQKTREAREADLEAYARRMRTLNDALRPLLPIVDRLDELGAATPEALRRRLPADAVFVDLLAYTFADKAGVKTTPSYAAFVITKDAVRWVELGPAGKIDSAVRLWREAITTAPDRAPLPDLPRAVRELVWEPIRKVLPDGVKVVYISPDAALTAVPWAALPGNKPGTVLLEELAVAVVPHGPALLDALWEEKTRRTAAGLLSVGGVSYGEEPERLGGWTADFGILARSRTRGELPTDPEKETLWKDLPGAKVEAEQVRTRAVGHGLDARLLTGPSASADRVLDELGRVRYAHLATHGFFADPSFQSVFRLDPKLFEFRRGGRERVGTGAVNPMVMSGLVFAGANRPNTPGRGVLTGEALLDRDLSGLELAVLSACETGLGNVADGQGVFGLQRAFHLAGCRNVVASLWKVDDEATGALMGEFYRHLWDEKNPLPPVEALRRAQLAVMRADPKDFKAMATRGPGKGDKKDPNIVPEIGRPMARGKTNPPSRWAAFTLSGPGTLSASAGR